MLGHQHFLQKIPTRGDWIAPLIIAMLTALGTVLMTANSSDKSLTARVSALEAHQTDDSSRLDHIQTQVDKLVEWALGSK